MSLPLHGIRIVDLTQYQQGTVCTEMLADWGADVIKVEPRKTGEPGRVGTSWGPPGVSGYFEAYNRNKRSITVDLQKERGKEIIYKLIKTADIFAQNFRPGVTDRLGFSYETLSRINPRIIYLTGSGFGLKGPLKDRPGFDSVGQAMGGIISVTGAPGCPEQAIGAAVGDQTGGFLLSWGALLALFDRECTGKGQQVDVSLLGGIIALQGATMLSYLLGDRLPQKGWGRISDTVFASTFRSSDNKSFIIQTVGTEKRKKVFEMLGIDNDPRFETSQKMRQNQAELVETCQRVFVTKTRDEWLKQLVEADIVCAPIYNYAEVAVEPQVLANDYITEIEHPTQGRVKVIGDPIKLSNHQAKIGIAPLLGQHTDDILKEAGYSEDEIRGLKKEEVV